MPSSSKHQQPAHKIHYYPVCIHSVAVTSSRVCSHMLAHTYARCRSVHTHTHSHSYTQTHACTHTLQHIACPSSFAPIVERIIYDGLKHLTASTQDSLLYIPPSVYTLVQSRVCSQTLAHTYARCRPVHVTHTHTHTHTHTQAYKHVVHIHTM